MTTPHTSNSTEQSNNLAFWLQMELDLTPIQVDRPQAQRCPMCCATMQEADDGLLTCPNCGLEVML